MNPITFLFDLISLIGTLLVLAILTVCCLPSSKQQVVIGWVLRKFNLTRIQTLTTKQDQDLEHKEK